MTNAEWRAEVQRREAVTADRRNRAIAKKARDNAARAAAASADQAEAEATRAGMMNPPGSHAQYAPWGQQGVGSPSPQPWGCMPLPGYADGDAHGGFNLNVTFPHGHPAQRTPSPAFAGVQYPPYNYSSPAYASSPTPLLRRGALPFSHLGDTDETEADMDDIIATGSAAAAASPGFVTPDDTVDLSGGMDGELGYVYGEEEQEEQEEEDEEEEEEKEEEPATVPARRRKKKKQAARSGEPHIKWASKEEECLAEAWKVVFLDPTTGTNQSIDTYWECIKAEFDERKLVDPYFKGVYMQRGAKAKANHWGRIQGACNKWHGIVEEVAARPESGASVEDQLLRMFVMYRQGNNDAEFKYLHVYKRIDMCEKWAEVRRTLDKAKETYKPDAPTPCASEGRPDGNKGAKKGKHADAATARVQESIQHCPADAHARGALREEKTEARWSALMSSSAVKLDLLRTNVAAKKRNTDLAFLLGGADMLQSNDEAVKAWYLAKRGLILNQLPSTTPPTPPPPPSPSDDVAETPRSTEATPTPPSTETPPSPRTPTPPTPEADLAV
ncbi:hypothetical protein VPH35_138039 [Triticum aestivum]